MRWNSFGGTLVLGVAAALGLFPAWLVVGSVIGHMSALSLYFTAVAVVYAAGLAPTLRRKLALGLVAGGAGLLVLVFAHGLREVAIGAVLLVSLLRAFVLYRSRPLRSLAIELALGVGGLWLAGFLAGSGPASIALGLWGYFLVQSLFFLIGGVRERRSELDRSDPFETARTRLTALLDEEGV